MRSVNLILALHSHQPVGNFDAVFERAYRQCYAPFLETLERHPEVRLSLHYSGCLLEWIEAHQPAFFDRLRALVARQQVELLGGGFYEPILVMLPESDRQGQIRLFTDYLEKTFGARVRGAWLTERVWEQSLTRSLADAGIEYTALDDNHFRNAGLTNEELTGRFITEDEGRLISVFPAAETLRYTIPFQDPEATIDFLRHQASDDRPAVVTYADDGEKFGVWPGTYEHVYTKGWLERFLLALKENMDWIHLCTLSEAVDQFRPVGRVYLPDASYREMTEWALPVETIARYEAVRRQLEKLDLWEQSQTFFRGGFWRNFKAKYPEANKMYTKMLRVSRQVEKRRRAKDYPAARRELYRAQCNCAYWHGVFGGLYLPHLRRGVYHHLLRAEQLANGRRNGRLRVECEDLDLDTAPEVYLSNGEIGVTVQPARGGHLSEFNVFDRSVNLLDTLARRKEAYHHKLLEVPAEGEADRVKSIHDLALAKQPGLEKLLHYDRYSRESLIDHFLDRRTTLAELERCQYPERGDFVEADYAFTVKKAGGAATVSLDRTGTVNDQGRPRAFRLKKRLKFPARGRVLRVRYELENASDTRLEVYFAVEFNLAFPGPEGRLVQWAEGQTGLLEACELSPQAELRFLDEPAEMTIRFQWEPAAEVWVFPIQTVSQSESGFEGIYQSSVVLPRWWLALEPGQTGQVELSQAVEWANGPVINVRPNGANGPVINVRPNGAKEQA